MVPWEQLHRSLSALPNRAQNKSVLLWEPSHVQKYHLKCYSPRYSPWLPHLARGGPSVRSPPPIPLPSRSFSHTQEGERFHQNRPALWLEALKSSKETSVVVYCPFLRCGRYNLPQGR